MATSRPVSSFSSRQSASSSASPRFGVPPGSSQPCRSPRTASKTCPCSEHTTAWTTTSGTRSIMRGAASPQNASFAYTTGARESRPNARRPARSSLLHDLVQGILDDALRTGLGQAGQKLAHQPLLDNGVDSDPTLVGQGRDRRGREGGQ